MSIINRRILLAAVLVSATALTGSAANLNAQQRLHPVRTSDLSDEDWNSWRIGVITSEEADKAYTSKNYTNAIALYNKAIELFQSVQKSKPSWNKKGIATRIEQLEKKKQVAERRKADQDAAAKASGDPSLQQKIAEANADAVAEISELKVALEDAQKKNLRLQDNLDRAKKTAAQVSALLKEKEELEKKHTLLLIQYNELQEKAASGEINQATKAAYEEARKRSEALSAELQGIRTQAEQLKKSVTDLTRINGELNQKNAELQARVNSLSRLEGEVANLQNKIKADMGTTASDKTQLQAEIARLKQALAKKSQEADQANEALTKLRSSMNLNDAARQLEQSVAALRAENSKYQKELAKISSDLAAAKKQIEDDAATIAKTGALARNLTEQNKLLTADIEKAKKLLVTRTNELKSLNSELNVAKADADRLRKERDAFATEIAKKPVEGTTSSAAELAQAKALLKSLNADNEKLKNAQAAAQKQQEAAKKQIAGLEKTVSDTEEKLKKAEAELKSLLEKDSALKKATEKTASLEKQLSAADARIKQLDSSLNNANSQLAKTAPMQSELKALQQKRAELEKEIAALKKESADQKKLIESAKMFEVDKLKKQLLDLNNEYAAAKKKLDELKKLTASTVQVEQELRAIRETVILLEAEKAALASEKAQLQQTVEYYERKSKEYENAAGSDALTRSLLQENKILKVELENARKVKPDEKFAAELATAKETITGYQNELQKVQAEYTVVKNSQLELRLNIVALEKELKALKAENAELKKNPAAAEALKKQQETEKEKQALQDKITENEHRIADLENLLNALKKEEHAQVRVLELLKKENAELKKKLENAAPAVKELEAKLAAAEKAAGEQLKLNDQLKRENRELKAQIQKALAEAGKVDSALKSNNADAAAAQKLASDLKAQNTLLKSQNEALKKQLEELKKEKAAVKTVTVTDTKAIDDLKKQNADLKNELEAAKQKPAAAAPAAGDTEKVKNLSAQLEKLEKDLTAANKKIAEREQAIAKLQNDLKNVNETMNKLAKDSSAAASSKIAKLQEENLKLTETIRSLQNEKSATGETLIQTKKELLSVKAQLEKLRSEVTADVRGKKLTAELNTMSGKLTKLEKDYSTAQVAMERLNQDNSKLASQNNLLQKQLDSAIRKTNLLQAEIQKWSAGNDAVIKGKVAEKDKVIDQIMQEHMAQAREIERLKTELEAAETTAAAARKDAIKARETLEEMKETQRSTNALTTTVTTGIRITPSGKKAGEKATAAKEPAAPASTEKPAEKKVELAPEVLKQYNEAFAEAEKHEKAGKLDEAMWKYLIAADLNPKAWQPRMAMSRLYLKAEKATKAKQEYEKALRLGMPRNSAHEKELSTAIDATEKK